VRDRSAGTTSPVSVDELGQLGASNSGSSRVRISSDGRYIAFDSQSVLVSGDTDGVSNVFVRDTLLGDTQRVDAAGNLDDLSADGRHLLITTEAALDPADTNGASDVYAVDLDSAQPFQDVALDAQGLPFASGTNEPTFGVAGQISADGSRVLFNWNDPAGGVPHYYVRDRSDGTLTEVGLDAVGANTFGFTATMDQTGYFVAFNTNGYGPNFSGFTMSDGTVIGGPGSIGDAKNQLLLVDLHTGTIELVSKNTSGGPATGGPDGPGNLNGTSYPAYGVSSGGQYVVFSSNRLDLVSPPLAPGNVSDIYRADREFVPAPSNSTPPSLSGTVAVGEEITCDPGTWQPSAGLAFDYAWLVDGVTVPGETNTSYLVRLADNGKSLACQVTASGTGGTTSVSSATTPVPVVTPPANTGGVNAPRITGTVGIGNTVTCQPGTWSGSPTPDFFYDWLYGTTPIAGATSSTYALSGTDAGKTIRCRVTAVNVAGSASRNSNPISLPAVPVNTRAPALSSNQNPARPGSVLTCTSGTWTGAPTYAYRWTRNGATVVNFPNTTRTYTVTTADLGASIGCVVRATNGGGSALATAAPTISVPAVPTMTVPTIQFTPPLRLNTQLTCVAGTVTPSSPSPTLAYRWTRDGVVIAGQTTAKHRVASADVGHAVRCEVRATNTSGSSAWVPSAAVNP